MEDVWRVLGDTTQKATISIVQVYHEFLETALSITEFGQTENIVPQPLDQGADINAVGGEFGTALGIDVASGNESIMPLLLNRGANINTVGGKFGTALGVAACLADENINSCRYS